MLKNIFSTRKNKTKNQDNKPEGKMTKEFENVIGFAKNAFHFSVTHTNCPGHYDNKVFDFIRMITDKLSYEYAKKCITLSYRGIDFRELFIPINHELNFAYDLSNRIYDDSNSSKVDRDFSIALGKDPVLSFPWDRERLEDAMEYATKEKPWKEDSMNHRAYVIFPVGVTWIHNGIHSGFSGVMSRQGFLNITERSIGRNYDIIDWSPLYTYIKFDGENYIFTGYNEEEELHEVIGKAPCFELGCIFEIGRILHKNGIRFHGIAIKPKGESPKRKEKKS